MDQKSKNVRKNENGFVSKQECSRIRILVCDTNEESCCEVSALLCQSSYQVTSIWAATATEVLNALNCHGPKTDIILAQVELVMENGAEILRYIMHHKDLQHIPVIILSTREQVSVCINGLRLGAADYLLKPLQPKQLSNLWMYIRNKQG